MRIEQYTINGKRQKNGLFGTPMNITSMDNVYMLDDGELMSAIIYSIGNIYKQHNISVDMLSLKHMVFNVHKPEDTERIYIHLDDYGFYKDKIYFFQTDKDRVEFYRMVKLKKLKEKQNVIKQL